MKLLPILLALTGCQYLVKHESKEHASDVERLREKYNFVYSEVESELDDTTSWPAVRDCDATLWAGLACTVGLPVKIGLAEYSPGELHRRPFEACWNEKDGDVGAKSTISRDMLVGYKACLWYRKDLAALQRLADYGEKHDWIMGKPRHLVSRVALTGNGIGLLGRAIFSLSHGQDDRYYRRTGYLFPPVVADYERHVQTQGILLQDSVDSAYNSGEKLTSINDQMFKRLKENAEAYPDDHLFAAALGRFTGDQSRALDLLLAFDPEEPKCSSYVRGEKPEVYCLLNWLQAAKILLGD